MDPLGINLLSLRTEEEERLWEEAVTPLWRVQDDTRTGLQRLLELARRIPARSAADERQALVDAITALARGGLMRVDTVRTRLEEAARRGDTTAMMAKLESVLAALAGQQAAQAVGEVGQAFDQAAQAVGGQLERLEQAAAPPAPAPNPAPEPPATRRRLTFPPPVAAPAAPEPPVANPPANAAPAEPPAQAPPPVAAEPAAPAANPAPPAAAEPAVVVRPLPQPPLVGPEAKQVYRLRRQVADLRRPWWRRAQTWAGFGLAGVIAGLAALFIAGWWAAGVGALLAAAWSLTLRTAALDRTERAEGLEEAIDELLHPRPAAPATPQPPAPPVAPVAAAEPEIVVRRRPAHPPPQRDDGA